MQCTDMEFYMVTSSHIISLSERESDRPLITDFGLAELLIGCEGNNAGFAERLLLWHQELAQAALENKTIGEIQAVRTVSCDIYSLGQRCGRSSRDNHLALRTDLVLNNLRT